MSELDFTDIQGNILKGYGKTLPVAHHCFLSFHDVTKGRAFVRAIGSSVQTAERWNEDHPPAAAINIGFTFEGLDVLGLPSGSLRSFPSAFQQGMRRRALINGDTGESDPRNWEAPWQGDGIHVWIGVYARDAMRLRRCLVRVREIAKENKVNVVHGQPAGRLTDDDRKVSNREHFGYADGISNPVIRGALPAENRQNLFHGSKPRADGNWDPVAPGEFLLDHEDEMGERPNIAPPEFGRNGTFMVWRKLHQNVTKFNDYLSAAGTQYSGGQDKFAGKIMGRDRDGTPLARSPGSRNNFTYEDDSDGAACPLGAHIRRANPRLSFGFEGALVNRHRIVRRGIPYGTYDVEKGDDVEHGLIFIALNASIERQFEFVQQHWMNYGNVFNQGNDKDFVIGNHDGTGRVVIQGEQNAGLDPYICTGLEQFVVTRGGGYFFIPSLTALGLIERGDVRPMS